MFGANVILALTFPPSMHTPGLVYLPEIKYRRILNRAFGPGGWALMPRGETLHFQVSAKDTIVRIIHVTLGTYFLQIVMPLSLTLYEELTQHYILDVSLPPE